MKNNINWDKLCDYFKSVDHHYRRPFGITFICNEKMAVFLNNLQEEQNKGLQLNKKKYANKS